MTSGAVTAIGLALRPIFAEATTKPGTQPGALPAVIVPAPYYHAYDSLVVDHLGGAILPAQFTMGTAIAGDSDSDDDAASWVVPRTPTLDGSASNTDNGGVEPLVAALQAAYDSATAGTTAPVTPAAVLLTHPHSPIGRPYTAAQLRAAACFAASHGLHLVVDEVYGAHVFHAAAPRFQSAASVLHEAAAAPQGTCRLQPTRLHIATGLGKLGFSGLKVGALWSRDEAGVLPAARSGATFSQISSDTQARIAALLNDAPAMDKLLAANRQRLSQAYGATVAALRAEGLPFVATTSGLTVLVDLRRALPAYMDAVEQEADATTYRSHTRHGDAATHGALYPAHRDAELRLRDAIQQHARVQATAASDFHMPQAGFVRIAFAATRDPATEVALAVRRLGAFVGARHPEVLAQSVRARLAVAWARSDAIFDMVAPLASGNPRVSAVDNALRQKPIQLRHPFIFYLGHLPGFAWLQLQATLPSQDAPAFNPDYDQLFERGIEYVATHPHMHTWGWGNTKLTLPSLICVCLPQPRR